MLTKQNSLLDKELLQDLHIVQVMLMYGWRAEVGINYCLGLVLAVGLEVNVTPCPEF